MKTKLALLLVLFCHFGFSQTVADADGNSYQTVTIGTQLWMAENLKTSLFNDYSTIAKVSDISGWSDYSDSTPKYCWYDNDSAQFASTYGALYTWHVVKSGKLCPVGWHVPTDAEWTSLRDYLTANGHSGKEGIALKSTTGWSDDFQGADGNGTDNYSFNALPSGVRREDGKFINVGEFQYWWSSTEKTTLEARCHNLYNYSYNLTRWSARKEYGASVRCLSNIPVGISEFNQKLSVISISPNPCDDVLNLSGLEENTSYFIYDLFGHLVKTANTESVINVSELASGVYHIRITDSSGTVIKTKKIVITH